MQMPRRGIRERKLEFIEQLKIAQPIVGAGHDRPERAENILPLFVGGDAHIAPSNCKYRFFERADVGIGPYQVVRFCTAGRS